MSVRITLAAVSLCFGCTDNGGKGDFELGRVATAELSVNEQPIYPGDVIHIAATGLTSAEDERKTGFRITNTGDGELAIKGLVLDSIPTGVFRLELEEGVSIPTPAKPILVAGHGASISGTLFVRRPNLSDVPAGVLTIESNSVVGRVSRSEVQYPIVLDIFPPRLTFQPSDVDFGTVPVGESRTATLAMINIGGDPLEVSRATLNGAAGFELALGTMLWASADSADIALAPPLVVMPNDQVTLYVQYSAVAAGSVSADFTAFSNDPKAPQGAVVNLRANRGTPTRPVVTIDAPSGADGDVFCRLVSPATDDEPLIYTWHWRVNDGPDFTTGEPTLAAGAVQHCDLVACYTSVSDGSAEVYSNVASTLIPFGADCDDGSECTVDGCHLTGGCRHQPREGECGDGDPCNGDEICIAGECRHGTLIDCSAVSNLCLESQCNPLTGRCDVPKPDGTICADLDLCDGVEECRAGICAPGIPVDCSNTGSCMENTCNPLTGKCDLRRLDGSDCSNSDACDGRETCAAGVCLAAVPVDCSATRNLCLGCNPSTGACDQALSDGTTCDDDDTCTEGDLCQSGSCVGEMVCASCGDGVLAVNEACDDGNSVDDDPCSNDCVVNNAPCAHAVVNGVHFIVCPELLTRETARGACQALGYQDLASIHSGAENDAITELGRANGGTQERYWIGLADVATENTFMWSDLSPVDYLNWYSNQPTPIHAGEDCVHTHVYKVNPGTVPYEGLWNDVSCLETIGYACQLRPMTACGETITDRDGNSYPTTAIGDQCWMRTNLRTTHDANGNPVTRHCHDCDKYGGHYEWSTVMNGAPTSNGVPSGVQGICPDGWHVPSQAELELLITFLGGHGYDCGGVSTWVAKSLAASGGWAANPWDDPLNCTPANAQELNDRSGFGLIGGGYWNPTMQQYYQSAETIVANVHEGYLWTATEVDATEAMFFRIGQYYWEPGFTNYTKLGRANVRCLRDDAAP